MEIFIDTGANKVITPGFTPSIFRQDVLDDLKQSIGSKLSQELLQMLRQQLQDHLGHVDETPVDRVQLARDAHMLVGSVGMLGFMELSECLRELEMACLNGNEVDGSLVRVRGARKRALQELSTIC